MKKVTKDEFFSHIRPLDVTLSITTGFPFTTAFKKRHGKEVGKIVDSIENGKRYSKYYLYL